VQMPRHAVLSWWPLKAALGRGERRLPPDIKQRAWRTLEARERAVTLVKESHRPPPDEADR
jgi:hypothetical protein